MGRFAYVAVLLGCLASIFPQQALDWDAANLKFLEDRATVLVAPGYKR